MATIVVGNYPCRVDQPIRSGVGEVFRECLDGKTPLVVPKSGRIRRRGAFVVFRLELDAVSQPSRVAWTGVGNLTWKRVRIVGKTCLRSGTREERFSEESVERRGPATRRPAYRITPVYRKSSPRSEFPEETPLGSESREPVHRPPTNQIVEWITDLASPVLVAGECQLSPRHTPRAVGVLA